MEIHHAPTRVIVCCSGLTRGEPNIQRQVCKVYFYPFPAFPLLGDVLKTSLQAQGDLEQEQLDAAEALVSAGQDMDELEQKTDSNNRRLEASGRCY